MVAVSLFSALHKGLGAPYAHVGPLLCDSHVVTGFEKSLAIWNVSLGPVNSRQGVPRFSTPEPEVHKKRPFPSFPPSSSTSSLTVTLNLTQRHSTPHEALFVLLLRRLRTGVRWSSSGRKKQHHPAGVRGHDEVHRRECLIAWFKSIRLTQCFFSARGH